MTPTDEAVEALARKMAAKLCYPWDGDTLVVRSDLQRLTIYPGLQKVEDERARFPLWKCFEYHALVALQEVPPAPTDMDTYNRQLEEIERRRHEDAEKHLDSPPQF